MFILLIAQLHLHLFLIWIIPRPNILFKNETNNGNTTRMLSNLEVLGKLNITLTLPLTEETLGN